MFSSMDLARKRSNCHQTPKHLAAGWVKMAYPAKAMDYGEGILESVDSISRDERGFPLTQYITNG